MRHVPRHPPQFAYPAAIGDLLAAVLALAAIPAVAKGALPQKSVLLLIYPRFSALNLTMLSSILTFEAKPAKGVRSARTLVWMFNVGGTLDLGAAITLATIYGAAAYMGPAYWIPAFWVPALLVTHYITFMVLRRYATGAVQRGAAPDRYTAGQF